LKPPEATRSRRPVNAVNRAQVQTLRPQRHLKPGYLGPCLSDPRRRSHDHAEEHKHARAAPQPSSRFDGAVPIPCRDGRTALIADTCDEGTARGRVRPRAAEGDPDHAQSEFEAWYLVSRRANPGGEPEEVWESLT